MNATQIQIADGLGADQPVFWLRQKDSERYWNGLGWAEPQSAQSFLNLDAAFNQAAHFPGCDLDLLVLFPWGTSRLIIPLEQQGV